MNEKGITQIIEEVCEEICDKYCKYRDQSWTEEGEISEICNNCPLNRLH